MKPALIVLLLPWLMADDDQPAAKPPTAEQLAAITSRGKLLFDSDQAAWHSSDAVQKLNPSPESTGRYIARKTDKGWVVGFGHLDAKKNRFLLAYEATQTKKPDEYEVKSFDPPAEDAKFYRSAAKAIDTAQKDFVKNFKGEQRPYNVAILPAEKKELLVYFLPAPTKVDVWPLGGDVRYLVSEDGARIVEKRQLHNSVIENPAPKPGADQKLAGGIHTHVLDDTPSETDVFHVLTRSPRVPEFIIGKESVFAVEAGGKIKYVGTTKEFLKEKQ